MLFAATVNPVLSELLPCNKRETQCRRSIGLHLEFKILFDKNIIGQSAGIPLKFRIDSLPTITFRLSRLGEEYKVGDQEPDFWNLIVQMAAGGSIKIGHKYRYSLAGFTKACSQTCGFFEFANNYQKFLQLYR